MVLLPVGVGQSNGGRIARSIDLIKEGDAYPQYMDARLKL